MSKFARVPKSYDEVARWLRTAIAAVANCSAKAKTAANITARQFLAVEPSAAVWRRIIQLDC